MTPPRTCPLCGAEYGAEQRFCARDGAALRGAATGASLVGEVLAERYLVQARLGEGGMGEVYRAEHVRMRRPCAVKVLRAAVAADPDAVSRFNREAANASRVSHPNVAAVYDFGETTDGLIYLAMELVEGRPLRALLDEAGALPPARALPILAQIAAGLDSAHALGIVHRDLKPDNVMLARGADGADVVKVVDFGIAKDGDAVAQQVTRTGLIVGTPEFMSPEQLAGDPVDARSDVYALALLAYAMLAGAHPFPAETVQDTLVLRLTTEPRRLADLRPDVPWPAGVQAVLDRALERRAAERTASAGALAQSLAAAYAVASSGVSTAAGPATAGLADDATQILRASEFAVPPTRVAPARAISRPRTRRALLAGTVAAAVLLAAAAWRGVAPDVAEGSARATPVAEQAADSAPPAPELHAERGETAGPPSPASPAPSRPSGATRVARADHRPAAPAASGAGQTGGGGGDDDALDEVERLLQSDERPAEALAAALRATERAAARAPVSTPAWYRAQADRALVLVALDDPRGCAVGRTVPAAERRVAIDDDMIRTMLEQMLLHPFCASSDGGARRP